MKARPANPESKDRPAPSRRRASRSFAPSSPALEGRDLLSTFDLDSLSATATVAVGSVSVTTTTLPLPPDPSGTLAGGGGVSASGGGVVGYLPTGGVAVGSGPALPVPPSPPPPSPPPPSGPRPPHEISKFRMGLAEADILVDGQHASEFAVSIPSRNVVLVKVGLEGPLTILSAADGINNPGQVVLKDVNGDGQPDLLVANTGGNNVLVFPGLPDGGVGPELNGGSGFAVGQQPTGITVGDVRNDGSCEVIVANWGSDNVTVLDGQGSDSNFSLVPIQTLDTGIAPVRTVIQEFNHDGKPDLFVLNSGSNDVTMYQGVGDGTFDTESMARFAVGLAPNEMFIGRFDHRPGYDLVTVNSGSNDVSFIAGINTSAPQTMTFTSGGTQPDAAFAVDLNHDGVLDLVVANGDGRVALLQGASVGLQLSEVITRPDLPAPTALAPDYGTGSRLDFYAAGAGQNAAEILHFDLGPVSDFLALPLDSSGSSGDLESELIAQLLPFGESDLELIAVLWDGDRILQTKTGEFEDRGESSSPVPYAKTVEEQAEDEMANAPANPSPVDIPPDDPASWVRYVLGIDLALEEPRDLLGTLTSMDVEADDPRPPARPPREEPPIDPDQKAATDAVDEALRSIRAEGPIPVETAPIAKPDRVGLEPVEDQATPPAPGVRARSIPVVASSVLVASRLIFKASPPRPPTIRRGVGQRLAATDPRPGRSSRR
jgi:hypothetical protein